MKYFMIRLFFCLGQLGNKRWHCYITGSFFCKTHKFEIASDSKQGESSDNKMFHRENKWRKKIVYIKTPFSLTVMERRIKMYMGQYYQGVETHFLGHFTWCIARLVAPEQKLVQQIFCLLILKLSGGSLQNKLY